MNIRKLIYLQRRTMEKAPLISIVIPARVQNSQLLVDILHCLERQTFQDFEVIIVCDRFFSHLEWEILQYLLSIKTKIASKIRLFSHFNSDFTPQSAWGASYVRNFGILQAKGEFIQLFDDDNRFDTNYLDTALKLYKEKKNELKSEVVITPSLYYRDTPNIQNQGFLKYNYRLARPQINFLSPDQDLTQIQMFSGNGVFVNAKLMQTTLYDEQIARIAEDLDFTYRLHKKGAKILTFSKPTLWKRKKHLGASLDLNSPLRRTKNQKYFHPTQKTCKLGSVFDLYFAKFSRDSTLAFYQSPLLRTKSKIPNSHGNLERLLQRLENYFLTLALSINKKYLISIGRRINIDLRKINWKLTF